MIKKSYFIIWLTLSFLTSACHKTPSPHLPLLMQADSISANTPQLAIQILDSLHATIDKADSSSLMHCLLLRIKAQDRAYIRHTSDHEILHIIDYYERHPEDDLLAWAYCYGGRVYRDLNDTPRALYYFQKSLAELKDQKGHNLYQRVLSQLGYLFYYQHLYDESRAIKHEVIRMDSLTSNYDKMVSNYTDIARCFIAEQKYDSAAAYANYVKILISQHQLFDQQRKIDLLKAQMLEYQGTHDQALKIIEPYLQESHLADVTPYLAVAGKAMFGLERYDEAELLCRELTSSPQSRLHAKVDASIYLSEIAGKRGNRNDVIKYQKQTILLLDSLLNSNQQESKALILSYYKNFEREQRLQQLQMEKEQAKHQLYVILSILSILSLIALLLWLQHKRHLVEDQLRQERFIVQFKSTELCQQLYSLYYAQQPIPSDLWQVIEDYIDDNIPNFLPQLRMLSSFGETEWHITLLSRLDFRNMEIAALLCKHKSAISLAKKRLYVKVKGTEGKAEDWDNLIKEFK